MSPIPRPTTGAAAATATLAYGAYDERLPVVHETLAEMVRRLAAQIASGVIANRGRAKLAELDERLLIDIGFALDEIPAVRAGETFTPRAAAQRPLWHTRRAG